MNRLKIFMLALAALFLACQQNKDSERTKDYEKPDVRKVWIAAHRGNSGSGPENTLSAFREVLELGVDYIEIDVRTTKDGQLVVIHDETVERTCRGSGMVKELTLAQLKKLQANRGFELGYPDEKIPTLEEAIRLVSQWNIKHRTNTQLYVDCKQVNPWDLIAVLEKYGMLEGSVFYGSDNYLEELKQIQPKAKLMPGLKSRAEIEGKLMRLNPYAFDVSFSILDEDLVHEIQGKGVQVFSDLLGEWDQEKYYQKALDLKIDLIQTDRVKSVNIYLQKK
jgi:glycerophosphoryl diester phosphodiesterase